MSWREPHPSDGPEYRANHAFWRDHRGSQLIDGPKAWRLVRVLEEIADADYRGNRSPESVRAHLALMEEGLR